MSTTNFTKATIAFGKHCKHVILWITTLLVLQTSQAAVTINSLIPTESRCQANGSIEVNAGGTNTPFIYSITVGPVTRPPQSNRTFLALPSGSYTVQVQNQIGESVSDTITVSGDYTLMTVKPIPVISCTSTSNGYIIGNVTAGGRGPYTWQLVAPSPITTVPQVSDTFYNLSDGSYTVRVTDSCGNFQTTGVVLSSVPSSLTFLDYTNYLLCNDSGEVQVRFTYTNLQFPMTLTTHDDNGDSTVIVLNGFSGYVPGVGSWDVLPDFNMIQIRTFLKHSEFGGVPWRAVITNPCGVRVAVTGQTASWVIPYPVGIVEGSCPPRLAYTYDSRNGVAMYTMLSPAGLNYYLFDSTLNAITDSGSSPNTNIVVTNGVVGHTYHLILENSCGERFTSLNWVWAEPAPPVVYPYPVGRECLDSTINMEFTFTGLVTSAPLTWVIKSGPPTLQSTKPGFAYSYSLSYPDTIITPTGERLELRNLPPGNYTFSVEDSCGQKVDSSFTILPSDIDSKDYYFTSTITGQCGIFNAINLFITRGDKYSYPFPVPQFTYTITNITTGQIIETGSLPDSVRKTIYNIPNGTYALFIDFFEFPINAWYLNNNDYCTTIYDTLVVNGSPFPRIEGFVNSFCDALIATEVLIDSSGGVPPYTIEIIAGPQILPPQTTNVFYLHSIGTYTYRLVDACGNSYVSATSIDTLKFPPIDISTTPCPGADVLLLPVVSPFYTYTWTLPDSSTFAGDTLSIPNVSASDTGIYIITRYADILGCKDTSQTTFHLELLARVSTTATICDGDSFLVGTRYYSVHGIYVDTLTAAGGCDSIVTTTLIVLPSSFGSDTFTVCQGEVITIGNHTYTINDTALTLIRDTITSSTGCDSIVDVHLTVLSRYARIDTVRFCQGDTLRMRIEIHLPGSVFIDTLELTASQIFIAGIFPGANGCDSTIIINAIASPSYLQLVHDTICQGQSVAVGNSAYTQPGNYLDTLTATAGCDSVILLLLQVRNADSIQITRQVCQGDSVNGHTTSGIYTDTFQNTIGCDSVVVLTLHVVNFLQDSIHQTICPGDSFILGNNTYTQAGMYRDTFSTASCDSIVILNLAVANYLQSFIQQTICTGDSFTVGHSNYTQPGTYRDTLSSSGCDSIVILTLSVLNPVSNTISEIICSGETFTVGNNTYNQQGTFVDTITTSVCDRIVTLHLTVLDYSADTIDASICTGGSLTINGHTYAQAGSYTDTLPSTPCDSILFITITEQSNPVIEAEADKEVTAAGEPVQLNVITTEQLTYIWTSTGGVLSNPTIQNPVGTMQTPAWFIVTATDTSTDCITTDSVFVDLPEEGCINGLAVPNAFTPNDDGANDEYRVFMNCPPKNFVIKIFNRWGEKVYESTDPDFRWDGTYKGVLQNPAVFAYYIEGSFMNGEPFFLEGSITLVL